MYAESIEENINILPQLTSFRLAKKEDLNELLQINSRLAHKWSDEQFEQAFTWQLPIFVLSINDLILGYIIWAITFDECRLLNFAIDNQYHRLGLGSQLLAQSLNNLQCNYQLTCSLLNVRVDNYAAIDLYMKFGYHILCRRNGYYTEYFDTDAYLMMLDPLSKCEFLNIQ